MNQRVRSFLPWRLIAALLRGMGSLGSLWPLLAIIVWWLAPTTVHMRWEYTYRDIGTYRVYYDCTYLGPSGLVDYMHGDQCPFFALIDRRDPRSFPGPRP